MRQHAWAVTGGPSQSPAVLLKGSSALARVAFREKLEAGAPLARRSLVSSKEWAGFGVTTWWHCRRRFPTIDAGNLCRNVPGRLSPNGRGVESYAKAPRSRRRGHGWPGAGCLHGTGGDAGVSAGANAACCLGRDARSHTLASPLPSAIASTARHDDCNRRRTRDHR